MPPVLNTLTPASGTPGTQITCGGSGFEAASQIACPALVATTFVSDAQLRATIPPDLVGLAGGTMVVSVFVQNPDGAKSAALPFTAQFPYVEAGLQGFTTVAKVAGEVPSFKRGGRIPDDKLEEWIRSIAQAIGAVMLRRGLSLDPAKWQQPDQASGLPSPAGVLEMVNRLGAAARLASAIAGDFTQGEWGLEKSLRRDYDREMKALSEGAYDKLFNPAAATEETGKQFSGGDIETDDGVAEQAFTKDQLF